MKTIDRLPMSFHETFACERSYLGRLLQFAQNHSSGTPLEISAATNIPQGEKSGKVTATIKYASGMGLISSGTSGGVIKLDLTPLGDTVAKQDLSIEEPLTQWLLHLNLCRKFKGAELWYQSFAASLPILGRSFSTDALGEFVESSVGSKTRSVLGPLPTMYAEDNCFKRCGALTTVGSNLERTSLPLNPYFSNGYASIFLQVWTDTIGGVSQIALTEFEGKTDWFAAAALNTAQQNTFIDLLADVQAISIDRQLGDAIIKRSDNATRFIANIYADLP